MLKEIITSIQPVLKQILNFLVNAKNISIIFSICISVYLLDFLYKLYVKIVKNQLFYQEIEITDELPSKLVRSKMPLTLEDVVKYIEEVKLIEPFAFKDIEEFSICKRKSELGIGEQVVASFNPIGSKNGKGRVEIYPVKYFKGMYRIPFPTIKNKGLQFTENEIKDFLYFSLSHELGHNFIYKKTGVLVPKNVEERCDKFAEILGIGENIEYSQSKVYTETQ